MFFTSTKRLMLRSNVIHDENNEVCGAFGWIVRPKKERLSVIEKYFLELLIGIYIFFQEVTWLLVSNKEVVLKWRSFLPRRFFCR